MIIRFHQGMSFEDWNKFSLAQQILNITSEMSRAKTWMKRGDAASVRRSLDRVYELTDLTIESQRKTTTLRELLIFRECLGSFYLAKDFSPQSILEFVTLMKCFVDFDPESHRIKDSLAA